MRNFVDKIPLTKQLVTIITDLEIGVEVGDLKIKAADETNLISLFEQYEFKTFLAELDNNLQGEDPEPQVSTKLTEYETIFSKKRLLYWISKIKKANDLAKNNQKN